MSSEEKVYMAIDYEGAIYQISLKELDILEYIAKYNNRAIQEVNQIYMRDYPEYEDNPIKYKSYEEVCDSRLLVIKKRRNTPYACIGDESRQKVSV